jgi:hypothetical protein
MNYGLSLGVTTHQDEGAFQATNTPADGAAHEDNYTMSLPFLALHDEHKLPARLRINFLHQDTTPELPTLTERLKNSFKFFGDDMIRTGAIGEFIIAIGASNQLFVEAAKRVAKAGWRAEVHSLSPTDFQQEIQGIRSRPRGISDYRFALGHRARAVYHRTLAESSEGNGRGRFPHGLALPRRHPGAEWSAISHDPGQWHPRRHEFRRHANRADESMAAYVLRNDGPERATDDDQWSSENLAAGSPQIVHIEQRLVSYARRIKSARLNPADSPIWPS